MVAPQRGDESTTFHGGYEPCAYGAIRAWFGVEIEEETGTRSLGGVCTSVTSAHEARVWIEHHARARGFDDVLWEKQAE